jgi:hypothetical protein
VASDHEIAATVLELWRSLPESPKWPAVEWIRFCEPDLATLGSETTGELFAVLCLSRRRVLDTYEFTVDDVERRKWRQVWVKYAGADKFHEAYYRLSEQGKCDIMEHCRVFEEWMRLGRPADIDGFIIARANVGPDGKGGEALN